MPPTIKVPVAPLNQLPLPLLKPLPLPLLNRPANSQIPLPFRYPSILWLSPPFSSIVMSPPNASSSLPSRPRFSWDMKSVPWTDGKGSQEEYACAVMLWSALHDKLPDSNNNKIPKELRGIMLQSQLYGRAKEICKKVPDSVIQSVEGVQAIVNAVYKRDALSTVSDVYQDFMNLLNLKRGANESFRNFESRFEAQVSKFNAHSDTSKIPASLTAFMLLANSNVDSSQRISVLAAAAPSSDNTGSTTEEFLKAISYDSVASVLRQCDRSKTADQQSGPGSGSGNALQANSASATDNAGFRKKKGRKSSVEKSLLTLKRKPHVESVTKRDIGLLSTTMTVL